MDSVYRTNPAIEFDVTETDTGGETVALFGDGSLQSVALADSQLVAVLERALEPQTMSELVADTAETLDVDSESAREKVATLASAGLLVTDSEAARRRDEWLSKRWNTSLLYNFASRDWTVDYPVTNPEGDGGTATPSQHEPERTVSLPEPAPFPDRPLNDVLLSRRTCREFDGTALAREEFASLLGRAFEPVRAERSGDGIDVGTDSFPFEIYPVTPRVDGVETAVYHYRVDEHELAVVDRLPGSPEAVDDVLQEIVVGQPYARDAAVTILFAADLDLFQRRAAGEAAFRQLLTMVSGHAHRLLVAATAAGLRGFQTVALEDSTADGLVGIDGYDEAVLYFVAVGHPTAEAADD